MTAKVTWRIRDNSDEYSSFSLEINEVDSLNYQDVARTDPTGAAYAIEQALDGLIVGNIASYKALCEDEKVNDVRPANGFAQVETAIRIYAQTAQGKTHSVTLATPDLATIAVGGQDELNLAQPEVDALVQALNSHWTPGGTAVTVQKIEVIGRAS